MPSLYARLRARHARSSSGPTRREMMQLTLQAAAGLLISTRTARGVRAAGPRVLIVGGGFAGLACAHELSAAGYDVRVFEARNRLGGRVLSFHDLVDGKTVEGGAELIGSNHPAWLAYKEKFKLSFLDVTDEEGESPIILQGKRLTAKEGEALYEQMDFAYARLNELAAPVDADEPWKSPRARELDAQSTGEWVDAQTVSALGRLALQAEFTADNGVPAARQSLLGNLAQIKGGGLERYWTETEVFRCRGGNQQLAAKLAAALGDRVRLRAAVKQIATSDRGATLRLADGAIVDGDLVVLAVPPSVWHKIVFDPPLPSALAPQMGANVKFLAVMRSRFWRRARLTPNLLSDGPVHLTWEATQHQPGAGCVLTVFSGGEAAETCRAWRPAERANNYLRTIETAYRDVAREFVKARFMDWPGDPWTAASYSFPAPGQVTSIGPMLHANIGPLHFAGEHTNFAFVGYMEGALGSGIRVARQIAAKSSLLEPAYVGA